MNRARSLNPAAAFVENPANQTAEDAVFRKISWRVMPLILIAYVCAFLDRINIGYAQLQMKHDLGFSDAMYGLGAAVFYVGYVLCEVPSNMLLARFGKCIGSSGQPDGSSLSNMAVRPSRTCVGGRTI